MNQFQKPTANSNFGLIIGLVSLGALLLLGAVLWLTLGSGADDDQTAAAKVETAATAKATVPEPKISPPELDVPSRPEFQAAFPSGVQLAKVNFRDSGPGGGTAMNVYLPKSETGDHEQATLGCVLVAPAGTNLLMGNEIGDDYHAETLPYAEAGFVAIQYSLDGYTDLQNVNARQMTKAYEEFRIAKAGTANARAVIAFVKQQLPEVDPQRIYVAGHSSAGTVALNNAWKLPDDIAACIAYAPCSDPEAFHREIYDQPQAIELFPGVKQFDRENSPIQNAAKIKCPLFVFHAGGDGVVAFDDSARFSNKVKSSGNSQVTFSEVSEGNHYNPMIETGIPRAIEWLKKLEQ